MHPETRQGATLKRGDELPSRQIGDTGADRFTSDTAVRTCQSERVVQRDATRGERIADDVRATIKGRLAIRRPEVLRWSVQLAVVARPAQYLQVRRIKPPFPALRQRINVIHI